jgi:hypothetical protein
MACGIAVNFSEVSPKFDQLYFAIVPFLLVLSLGDQEWIHECTVEYPQIMFGPYTPK